MERKTRKQILRNKRKDIICRFFADGFLMAEIAWIFKIQESRVSQILKKVGVNQKPKK